MASERNQDEERKSKQRIKRQQKTIDALIRHLSKLRGEKKDMMEKIKNQDILFSIIAHDLRTPFSSLLGLTQFMAEELETLSAEDIKLFAEGINSSAVGMYDLLENLLGWSRMQMGTLKYSPRQFFLKEMVEESLGLFQANAVRKRISLSNEIDPNLQVFADSSMVNTVIRNLISNAIKFTFPEGTIRIRGEQEEQTAKISVIDNGVGITTEGLHKLFNMEAHYTTPGTQDEKGTGLGLVLSQQFVEQNKGAIWAESELGRGTTFSFTLPLHEDII